MKKYVYKTKDGKLVYSDEKLERDDLELVRSVKTGQMVKSEIIQKENASEIYDHDSE